MTDDTDRRRSPVIGGAEETRLHQQDLALAKGGLALAQLNWES